MGGDTWQHLSGFTLFPGFLPILPLFFGLIKLCREDVPRGKGQSEEVGKIIEQKEGSEAEAWGGGAASAMKDASHALGGLMGRGWGALGRGAFLLK